MLSQLTAIDRVSIVALARDIQFEYKTAAIGDLAFKLKVPLMSESRNRPRLVARLNQQITKSPSPQPPLLELAVFLIAFLLERLGAIDSNRVRKSYAGWFRRLCVDCHDRGHSYAEISKLTGVEIGTIEGFKGTVPVTLKKESMDDKTKLILEIWNTAMPGHKSTLDSFISYFSRQEPNIPTSRDEMRTTLINLGLHTPRGPRIKNAGTQVKKPFAPHSIWEGDGKLIKVQVNGVETQWIWYALADQSTTLLVGASTTKVESAASFLNALKNGQKLVGLSPIGVLLDNRLEGSELGPVRDFCKEHGIIIARTFPGNPKSNGIIEGNFSIFERFVGNINVTGATPEAIGQSIAMLAIEIFTQQRNHSPRKRLGGKSPSDITAGVSRPEHTRNAIEALARRLNREQRDAEALWNMISKSRVHFGTLSEATEQKIKRQLIKYPVLDIIAAEARFLAQISKHPMNTYSSEYFLAILRHKRETIAKTVFNETYCAGILATLQNQNLGFSFDEDEAADAALNELIAIEDLPSPTHKMLRLDALAWWLVSLSAQYSIDTLWKKVESIAARSIRMSLRWWSTTVEYLAERIGLLLYKPKSVPMGTESIQSQMGG